MSGSSDTNEDCPSFYPFDVCGGKGKCINGKCICDNGWISDGDLYFTKDNNDCVTYIPALYILHVSLLILSCWILYLSINCFLSQFRNHLMKKENNKRKNTIIRLRSSSISFCSTLFPMDFAIKVQFFIDNVSTFGFRKLINTFTLSRNPSYLFSSESFAFSIIGIASSCYRLSQPMSLLGKDPFITTSYCFMFLFTILMIVNFIHTITNFLAGVSRTMAANMRHKAFNDALILYSCFPVMKITGSILCLMFLLCLPLPSKTRIITMLYDILMLIWITFAVLLFILKAANPMINELGNHLRSMDKHGDLVVDSLKTIHWRLRIVRLVVMIVYPLVACGWMLFGAFDPVYRLNVYFIPFTLISSCLLIISALIALSNKGQSDTDNKPELSSNKVSAQNQTSDKADRVSGQKQMQPASPKGTVNPNEFA